MQLPGSSAGGTSIRRSTAHRTAKQYDSDDFSCGNYKASGARATRDDFPSEKPELEAYCQGSWWDVKILEKDGDRYFVHYQKFDHHSDQWVPISHLRMRCRIAYAGDCEKIVPGMDVCVMTWHPHLNDRPEAWYDARIVEIQRNPHASKACPCWFRIALYTIPSELPSDFSLRRRLPNSKNRVSLKDMSIMREARRMSFRQVVAASLPGVASSRRSWAKDGSRWNSSLDDVSLFQDRSFSFESRVAGGSFDHSLSEGHREDSTKVLSVRSFDDFLEEEGLALSPHVRDEDRADIPVVSGSKAQPIILDVDDSANCDNEQVPDTGITYRERYSSDDSDDSDERAMSPERREVAWRNPNLAATSVSLGIPDEVLDEVVVSDLHSLQPKNQSPVKSISVTPDKSSPSPSVQTIPSVRVTVRPVEPVASSQDSDLALAEFLERNIPSIPVTVRPVEPVASSQDSELDLAEFLESSVPATAPTGAPATSSENSADQRLADYLLQSLSKFNCDEHIVSENPGAKRNVAEKHGAKRSTENLGAKRRRLNSRGKLSFQEEFYGSRERSKTNSLRRAGQQLTEHTRLRKTVKGKATVFSSVSLKTGKGKSTIYTSLRRKTVEKQATISRIKGGKNLDTIAPIELEDYIGELEELLKDDGPDLTLREKLAHTKDASKTALPPQGLKDKKSRKVAKEVAAVPRFVEKEITYAELFESMEPVRLIIPSEEKVAAEESALLPSWNPSIVPAHPLKVKDDPFADIWEVMRIAQESEKEVDRLVKEIEECTDLVGTCEHPDGSKHSEHGALKFDQEYGEVCEECGVIVNDIKDMWTRDNAKRIAVTKEGNSDSDVDNDGCDQDVLASWHPDDENHIPQKDIGGSLNFELIPDLAKDMKPHQKEGFQFLWRNLDGHGSYGNACFEKGGCVLSHAPGTGKTFLIISFLHSFMKKYPNTRPIILAPKIMLQPWQKEFTKWNVDIPVYNFNQAHEEGRVLLQKHEDDGRVRINQNGRSQVKKLLGYREAMIWQWIETKSVLIISYPMFNNLYKTPPSDARLFNIRKLLLERPTIMILDEGHVVRNKQAQVLKQLNAVKTPLRVMLSGTLFQNNFEELYTCLNAVRSGFVKTFAKSAGFRFNIPQEPEIHGDVEGEQSRKDKASKITEIQARKLFIEEIGNKIDKGQKTKSSSESLAEGLDQLRRLTSPFIHHYTGGVLKSLKPLRDFAIIFQPTDLQEKMIQNLTMKMEEKTMLERECLLSLVCIHPTLFFQHNVGKTYTDLLPREEMRQVESNRDPAVGVKTRFVINLLKHLRYGQEKILIFCQNLDPLLLLEEMLGKQFGWVRDREILQIDGKVCADDRQNIIARFNDPDGRIRVLLASTKACGEGVTLTGASRVVFMDVLWNPAVIRQAIHRAFRIGQKNVVHVYRLICSGTFEEEKYKRMVWKDHKSQAIFFESQENAEKNSSAQPGFWEIKKQSSKDLILNELCRQDSELGQPEFKYVFRHGGLFDDDYEGDPEGKGADATDWLRGIEGVDSFDLGTDDSSGDDGETEDFDGFDEDV